MAKKHALYIQPAVTVDVVIFTIEDGELKALLIRRANEPFRNALALPGGFLHEGETTEGAALRILRDKAGVRDIYVEQLYTFDTPHRDPRGRVLTVAYFALVPRKEVKFKGGEAPALYPIKHLPKLAFDHVGILRYAETRLRAKLGYTNAVFSLLPAEFVFADLQKIYEAVLGKRFDKRNFRKKFMSLGLIKATGKKLRGARQRPAELYRFASRKHIELVRFF